MVKRISVENFFSIGEKQELSFHINKKDALNESSRTVLNEDVINVVSTIVGHNASGKTAILKAFSFLFWFVGHSYEVFKKDSRIPIRPHFLKNKKSTIFEIDFFEKDFFYEYSLELDRKVVIKESLSRKKVDLGKTGKRGRTSNVFEWIRSKKNLDFKIGAELEISESDLKRHSNRPNVSLLSTLIALEYLPDFNFFDKFETNVGSRGMRSPGFLDLFDTSEALYENEKLKNEVLSFSKHIDLGISDFRFSEIVLKSKSSPGEEKQSQLLQCVHPYEKGEFVLPFYEESNGTQRSFSILSEILPVLQNGGVVAIDEIEVGLHPFVVRKIISLFESKRTNPKNAQLIFSTHQHILLNDRTKTQIFLVEKSLSDAESEVFRLDEVDGVRNDENYFHKYLAGAYGGTPRFNWLS